MSIIENFKDRYGTEVSSELSPKNLQSIGIFSIMEDIVNLNAYTYSNMRNVLVEKYCKINKVDPNRYLNNSTIIFGIDDRKDVAIISMEAADNSLVKTPLIKFYLGDSKGVSGLIVPTLFIMDRGVAVLESAKYSLYDWRFLSADLTIVNNYYDLFFLIQGTVLSQTTSEYFMCLPYRDYLKEFKIMQNAYINCLMAAAPVSENLSDLEQILLE